MDMIWEEEGEVGEVFDMKQHKVQASQCGSAALKRELNLSWVWY